MINLSVIVPVCNVEKYLSECLNSILMQKKYPKEVICVNDGSTDNSLAILKQFEAKDNRINIIDRPNSGYGDSMNVGLSKATGDYIGIVESDDVVINGSFEKMLSAAEKTNADIVKGNFNYYIAEENKETLHPNFQNYPYEKLININEYPTLLFTAPAIWSGIYKRSFLKENRISFLPTPGASYQDTSFAFKTWVAAKSICLISDPIINYRQDSSGSSSNISKKVFNIFNETSEMKSFLHEHNLESFYPEFVKTKFISYNWTLNRLNANDKRKFFLRWLPELKSEFEHGYFIKKYWDDYNWNYIHQLVFNSDKVIDSVCEGKNLDSPTIDKISQFAQVSPVYIYGAGKCGIKKKQELESLGVIVNAFIVSERRDNPKILEEIPVIPLAEIDKDGIIFIGVSDKYRSEVIETLKNNWLLNNIMTI